MQVEERLIACTRICKHCKQLFMVEYPHIVQTYCSIRCTADSKITQPSQICPMCETAFRITPADVGHRYCCSRPCSIARLRMLHPGSQEGYSYSSFFRDVVRLEVLEEWDYECQGCGVISKKLCVHHIDYDIHNNCKINLIPLCRGCHIRTNFNREEWKEYYQQTLGVYNGRFSQLLN